MTSHAHSHVHPSLLVRSQSQVPPASKGSRACGAWAPSVGRGPTPHVSATAFQASAPRPWGGEAKAPWGPPNLASFLCPAPSPHPASRAGATPASPWGARPSSPTPTFCKRGGECVLTAEHQNMRGEARRTARRSGQTLRGSSRRQHPLLVRPDPAGGNLKTVDLNSTSIPWT